MTRPVDAEIKRVTVTLPKRQLDALEAIATREDVSVAWLVREYFPKLPVWAALSRGGQWESVISPESIVVAFCFSVGVGVFFGLYPAYKASRMNPVDALRYE